MTTSSSDTDYDLHKNVKRIVVQTDGKNRIKRFNDRVLSIRRIVEREKFDCIISFSAIPNIQILMATIGMRIPIIISERTDPSRYPDSFAGKFLRKILYGRAQSIVFQTPDARDYFPKYIRNKSVIIPNPLSNSIPDIYEGEREKKVVGVGALVEQKNWSVLLKACVGFLKEHDDYQVHIYGEGDERDKLQNIINNNALLRGKVFLMGFSSNVLSEIRNARIYVSSSDYEGISNAMLEALALGIPSICTDCPVGGARQFISNGKNGILVKVRDSSALEDAMNLLASNDDFCYELSANAVKIRGILETKVIVDKWEKEVLKICC